jgi:hypothetical protein
MHDSAEQRHAIPVEHLDPHAIALKGQVASSTSADGRGASG